MEVLAYIGGFITLVLGIAYFVGLKELKSEVHPFEHHEDATSS